MFKVFNYQSITLIMATPAIYDLYSKIVLIT